MPKALLLSENFESQLYNLFSEDYQVFKAHSVSQAEDFIDVENFSISILEISALSEDCFELLENLLSNTNSVIFLICASLPEQQKNHLSSKGIFIFKSFEEQKSFFPFIKNILSNIERINSNQKFSTSQKKAYEQKIISRAKYALMTNLSMTEIQAHKFIEQQSMNLCQNLLTTAESILKTYEN